jgi:hypothetical protein
MTPVSVNGQGPQRMSGWALRKWADRVGLGQMSDGQLKAFAEWGLLDRDARGYAADSLDRLPSILEAGSDARSMPRRVVRLRGNHDLFPVPPEPLRRAMVELAPTISRPIRKLARVLAAQRAFAERIGQRGTPRKGRLPAAASWPALLRSVPLAVLDSRVMAWYQLVAAVLPTYLKDSGHDLSDIPIEEQVVLLAVLDLSHPRTTSPPAIQP